MMNSSEEEEEEVEVTKVKEEDEESIDIDSPRPPMALLQDAYDVSRDFFFYMKKGIKEGGHYEWYENAAAKAKEIATKSGVYVPESLLKKESVVAPCEANSGVVVGLTSQLSSCGAVVSSYACWLKQLCAQNCQNAFKSITGVLASAKIKIIGTREDARKESLTRSAASANSGDSSGFVPSNGAEKLAPIFVQGPAREATVLKKSGAESDLLGKPKREVKDFLHELPHTKIPDLPSSFYNLGDKNPPRDERGSSAPATTIILPPQRKRVQAQEDNLEEEEEEELPPNLTQRRFEHSVPLEDKPSYNHSAINHSMLSPAHTESIQRDFSSSNTFAARFGAANDSTAESGGPSNPDLGSHNIAQLGPHGPGMALIDDTIASFEAQYQSMNPNKLSRGEIARESGQTTFLNGFGSVTPPFSQLNKEHDLKQHGFQNNETKLHGPAEDIVTSNEPQKYPMQTSFSPPERSSFQPKTPYIPPEQSHFHTRWEPSSTTGGNQATSFGNSGNFGMSTNDSYAAMQPKVRHADRQWPPPSNATWAPIDRNDVMLAGLKHGFKDENIEAYPQVGESTILSQPAPLQPSNPVDDQYYTTPINRDRSPSPVRKHQNPPTYEQHTSRARAFSPNYYSTPRPFSPTYDAPRPFSPVGPALEPQVQPYGKGSNSSQTFGPRDGIKIIRVDGQSEDLDRFKQRASSHQPLKMGILL